MPRRASRARVPSSTGVEGGDATPTTPRRRSAQKAHTTHARPPREGDDDDGWHWTRWLFASKLPQGYALFAHGFDVALVSELGKVEALYARELRVLSSRWQDALADDFGEQDPEKARGGVLRAGRAPPVGGAAAGA